MGQERLVARLAEPHASEGVRRLDVVLAGLGEQAPVSGQPVCEPVQARPLRAARPCATLRVRATSTASSQPFGAKGAARATTLRLDGVKAPLTVVGDAYKNNVLRFRKLWRRDQTAPALCLDDPQALLVIRRP